jgi:hypothetical protein
MFRMDVGLVNDGIENVVMLIRDLEILREGTPVITIKTCSFEYY